MFNASSYSIAFEFDAIGYRLLKGHRIQVSLSPSYWPLIWTPRKATTLEISSATFSIPTLDLESSTTVPDICPTPVYGPKLKIDQLKGPFYKRYLEYG